ncbi:hypothetical protein OSC27_07850 [Microbacterium sp. STN6]|uniref:DUF6993 domain-containing protein n=1 Tax=Microbacterium sp. STN6 TaxID=2995588 RepID=UPI002260F844|nr:hypothetical protein [Microbacterium sp. STN6]MCX7522190.1 hypothetical protein [Microbacterium sp. STN6]
MPRVRVVAALAAAAVATLALSACTGSGEPAASHTATAPASEGASAPTSTPAAEAQLRPRLSAEENLAFFDQVNRGVIAADSAPGGRDFVDALVSAGFDKEDMQVTPDRTTIDLAVGSVQFSVRFNGDCLIGQYGADGVGYHSMVTPLLSTGNCLIGKTRTIDW